MIRAVLFILCLASIASAESLTIVQVPVSAAIQTGSDPLVVSVPQVSTTAGFTPEADHFSVCDPLAQSQLKINKIQFVPGADWRQTIQPTVNGTPVDVSLQNYRASFSSSVTAVDIIATIRDWYLEGEVYTEWIYTPTLNGSMGLALDQNIAPATIKPGFRQATPDEDTVDFLTTPISGQKLWRFPLSDVVGPMNVPQSIVVTYTWIDREFSSYWDWVATEYGQANSSEPLTMEQAMTIPLVTTYPPVSDTVVYEIGQLNGYKRWTFPATVAVPSTVVTVPLTAGIAHSAGNIVLSLDETQTRLIDGLTGYFRLMGNSTMITFPMEPYPSVTRP